jgi:hypothetical protein
VRLGISVVTRELRMVEPFATHYWAQTRNHVDFRKAGAVIRGLLEWDGTAWKKKEV